MKNRPVKKYTNSGKNLPFVLILSPMGNNKRLFPYPIDLVTKTQGVDIDFYANTGKSKITGYKPGYTVTYRYDRENRVQRNKIPLHSYIYGYKFTISDERVAL